MDNSCVIGYGVVGGATAEVFGIKKIYDIDETKSNITLEEVAKCRFVFICVPTPLADDGGYIVDHISDLIRQIEQYQANCLYIIRSTVYPGFANYIMENLGIDRVISNPEFLTEATAEKDSKFPPFVLLGGAIPRYLEEVKGLYEGRIKAAPVVLTDNITAETAKLAMNSYFSTKVIFANQLYDICRTTQANYEKVKEVLERHPFGPRNHFTVWFNGRRGVHGKCLPKDTKAFAHYSNSELLKKVLEFNENYIGQKEEE